MSPGIEPHALQLSAPVVSATASLHCNQAPGRQLSAPCQELATLNCSVSHDLALGIYRMYLQHILGDIHTDSDNGLHGTTPGE